MDKNSSAKTILQRTPIASSSNYYPTRNHTCLGRIINRNNPAGGSVRNWDQFWSIRHFENDIITKVLSIQFQISFMTLMMITSKINLPEEIRSKWELAMMCISVTVLGSSLLFATKSLCQSTSLEFHISRTL